MDTLGAGIKGVFGNKGGSNISAEVFGEADDQPFAAAFIDKVVMQNEDF